MGLNARRIAVAVGIVACGVFTSSLYSADPAPAGGPLKVLQTFTLGGAGRWDYITVDPDAHRLYIPRSTRVAVVDSDKGTVIGEIPDTSGVHGVAIAPEANLGFSSNGKDNSVTAFDLKTLKVIKKITTGKNPDAIIYDPASKHIFAMDHSGGDVTVIDPTALDKEAVKIDVGGELEAGVSDGAGHVYVNVEDKSEVVAIDSKTNKVLAHWSIAPGEGPTGLALDVAHHRLFSGCDGNAKMVVLDSETGKVITTVPIGKGVDGCGFDVQLGLAYSANGKDGTLTAIKSGDTSDFTVIQTLTTGKSLRTMAVDGAAHKIYLPGNVPDGKGGNTFGVVVVGPQ